VAELHEDRSIGFILQFAAEILLVVVVFGTLFLIGLYALYKLVGGRSTIFCLLGICLPILGTFLYAFAPRATYNVRYSIAAFPYFCILLGAGSTYVFEKYRPAGVVLFLGILAISSVSLANHFFNPRYAKEDIRSAVAFWRSESTVEPLLSFRSYIPVSVYLRESEMKRHSALGGDTAADISLIFSKIKTPTIYILLARDWKQLKEKEIRGAYRVENEKSYPGVKILRVVRG
jgi:hypothetical protein